MNTINGDFMKHTIDLAKYQIRTDLTIEAIGNTKSNIQTNIVETDGIKVTTVHLDKNSAKEIQKNPGNYITIEFEDITDYTNHMNVLKIFTNSLKQLLESSNIKEDDSCLIIGLGNDKSTPDALGPLTIDKILVTRHLFMYDVPEDGFRNVSAITPGVTGETGIETGDLIISVVKAVKPDFVIVIDALASQSVERVNKTIQMSDTGIHPGSGVGNKRKEISESTLGVPVIAIGVPTVVDAITIVSDTIHYMQKHYAFHKEFIKNPMSNLTVTSSVNYLNKEVIIDEEDKKNLLGIVGTLNENETKQLINEVLTPIGYNLMVTTKEIDFVIDKLSSIIGSGINQTLHKNVSHDLF